jgi:hypothetical protein
MSMARSSGWLLSLFITSICFFNAQAQEVKQLHTLVPATESESMSLRKAVRAAWSPLQVISAAEEIATQPWPSAERNFSLLGSPRPLGDVDGTGRGQVIISSSAVDERIASPLTLTSKSALLFGAGISDGVDEVIYADLRPLGDVTGNGYDDAIGFASGETLFFEGSASGLNANGVLLSDFPVTTAVDVIAGFDLDGDGINDMVIRPNGGQTSPTWIAFGASNPADFEYIELDLPASSMHRLTPAETSDGTTYLVGIIGNTPPSVIVVSVDGDRVTSVVQTIEIPSSIHPTLQPIHLTNSMYPFAIDITGDGYLELYVRGNAGFVLTQDESASGLAFNDDFISFGDQHITPIGDIDGDGRVDFIVPPNVIRYGFDDLSGGIGSFPSFAIDTHPGDLVSSTVNSFRIGYPNSWGDLTGNGLTDFVLTGNSTAGMRHYVVEGAANRNHEITEVLFSRADHGRDNAMQSVALGDVTGNGIDDLAIIYQFADPRVELFEGGSPLSTPVQVFRSSTGAEPIAASGGFFSGHSQREIAISWLEDRSSTRDHFIDVRRAPSYDVVTTITAEDLIPDRELQDSFAQGLAMLVNLGDINNDGADNLMVGAPNVLTTSGRSFPAVLMASGANLTASPIHTFAGTSMGYGFAPVGDLNGDGIPDFAVTSARDVIDIYYGWDSVQTSTPSFDTPAQRLRARAEDPTNLFLSIGGIASGDFNGNGQKEIATLTWRGGAVGTEPIPSIYIFPGDAGGDTPPVRTYPLSTELFRGATGEYLPGMLAEIIAIPDQTGNGAEELLVGSFATGSPALTDAVLFLGSRDGFLPARSVVFEAPYDLWPLGADNNNIWVRRHSAVLDFTGDGTLDMVLPQIRSIVDRGTPMWRYALDISMPPVALASAPPDVQLGVGDAPLSIRLSDTFANWWLASAATVTSTDPSVARVSTSGNRVYVEAVGDGTADVTITAHAASGDVQTSFGVTVGVLVLDPDEELSIPFVYNAEEEGEIEETLTIEVEDDDDIVVEVKGEVIDGASKNAGARFVVQSADVRVIDLGTVQLGTQIVASVEVASRQTDRPLEIKRVTYSPRLESAADRVARLQIIHAAGWESDVYDGPIVLRDAGNNVLRTIELDYLDGTTFLTVPANQTLTLEAGEEGSFEIGPFDAGISAVAAIVAPDADMNMRLALLADATEKTGQAGTTVVRFIHGGMLGFDPIDIVGENGDQLVSSLSYLSIEEVGPVQAASNMTLRVGYFNAYPDFAPYAGRSATFVVNAPYWAIATKQGMSQDFALVSAFGASVTVPALQVSNEAPDALGTFALRSVHPNPSRDAFTLTFDAPTPGSAHVVLYDILGRQVYTSASQSVTPGSRELSINASLPAGTYLYRLVFEGHGERHEAKGSLVRVR